MISIFVMYSPDREPQFRQQVSTLEEMDFYDRCQKILVVDGEGESPVEGWEIRNVPRTAEGFNWSSMWNAGVQASVHDIIWYLDSDRILPRNYIGRILHEIDDNKFLFCQDMFNFKRDVDDKTVRFYRDEYLLPDLLKEDYDSHRSLLAFDPRFRLPCNGTMKGVMSGNTAFTKKTFEKSGGVDPFYCGHGAWADSDYHQQCWKMGMEMIDLKCLELHLFHDKKEDDGSRLSRKKLELLSLNNYVRYCCKWGLDLDHARYIARCLDLDDGFIKRVRNQLDRIDHLPIPGGLFPLLS